VNPIRKRLTYANVMSSVAVFLLLGGATAVAAKQLGKKTVGTAQLKANAVSAAKLKRNAVTNKKIKKNAVTGIKVRNGSLSGEDINLGSLGTVPSAATAGNLTGRVPFQFFMGEGERDVATFGPFTLRARCGIDVEGEDEAELQFLTSLNNSTLDSEDTEEEDFDIEDNPVEILQDDTTTGEPDIYAGAGFIAAAPNGTVVQAENYAVGMNVAERPGQCFFSGSFTQLS
jgi:hypothetical protein